MYVVKDYAFLSEEENNKLLNEELDLTRLFHVSSEEEVPVEDYPYKYEIGKDIELIWIWNLTKILFSFSFFGFTLETIPVKNKLLLFS